MSKPSTNFKNSAMSGKKSGHSRITNSLTKSSLKSSSFFNMLEKVRNTSQRGSYRPKNQNLLSGSGTGIIATIDTSRSRKLEGSRRNKIISQAQKDGEGKHKDEDIFKKKLEISKRSASQGKFTKSNKTNRSTSRTLKEVAKPTYYMKYLEYYLKLSKSNKNLGAANPFCKIYKEHFVQSVAAFKFVNRLRIPTNEMMSTI